MPPLLDDEESALDPYGILGLSSSATDKDIKKAYRQLSLKYHPDKNPSPDAAIKLRQVFLSLEILSDVAKRQYVDTKLEAERKRKEKYAEMDKKRKVMVDALNAREEEAKRAKVEATKRKQQEAEEEAIKDAGRRMLEEAQRRAAAAAAAASSSSSINGTPRVSTPGAGAGASSSKRPETNGSSSGSGLASRSDLPPEITPVDLTLILQFPPSSSSSAASVTFSSTSLESALSARYGPISHVFLKDPPEKPAGAGGEGKTKKKKDKGKKAIVEFAKGNWGGCWACWRDHSDESANEMRGLEEGTKVKWAAGKIPDWVDWAERQRQRTQSGGTDRERERERATEGESRPDSATTRGRGIDDQASPNGLANGTRTNGANGANRANGGIGLPGGWGATADFTTSTPTPTPTPTPSFASAPDFGGTTMADLLAQHASGKEAKRKEEEYESMTLLRMRQLERERIEEQIRRQEEEEGE